MRKPSLLYPPVKNFLLFPAHLLAVFVELPLPDSAEANAPENTDKKQQLLIINRSGQGAPKIGLGTIRPLDRPDPGLERVAKANGFSLHAGVTCEGHQKEKVRAGKARDTALGHKRERLCR